MVLNCSEVTALALITDTITIVIKAVRSEVIESCCIHAANKVPSQVFMQDFMKDIRQNYLYLVECRQIMHKLIDFFMYSLYVVYMNQILIRVEK